jgi:cation:H+ antiporter
MFWDIFLAVLFLIIGFIMLSKGADWFVDGAAGLAEKLRIPTLVIGLTIVSFGTTAPELSTSIISALQGNVGVAVGNALGSNICNILLILGLSSVLAPVPAKKESRTLAIPVLLIASVLILLFGSLNDQIDRWEGIFLLVFMIAYTSFLIVNAFKNRPTEDDLPLETPEFTPELDEEENANLEESSAEEAESDGVTEPSSTEPTPDGPAEEQTDSANGENKEEKEDI